MTNLTENSVWESGVFQLEVDTPTLGGPPGFDMGEPVTGHANAQAQQLANRTQYLKTEHEALVSEVSGKVSVSDLANTDDPLKGAALIGRTWQAASSVAQLRTLSTTGPARYAETAGYYAPGDGGGGLYYASSDSVGLVDDGGSVIQAIDGGFWLLNFAGEVSLRQFGAKGDGVDDTASVISAIAVANAKKCSVYAHSGSYRVTQSLDLPDNGIRGIRGAGKESTRIVFAISSGLAIMVRSYYTRAIYFSDISISLEDQSNTVSGIKVSFSSAWGGGVAFERTNVVNFTENVLELEEGFNCSFNCCEIRGGTQAGVKVATLLKATTATTFGACNSFTNCVFHIGKIGFQNFGGTTYHFETCTFEALTLFLNIEQLVGLSMYASFNSCWFENITKGIVNAAIDQSTLAPLVPVQKKALLSRLSFRDCIESAGVVAVKLDQTVEPFFYNKFDFRNGIIRTYQGVVHYGKYEYSNGLTNDVTTLRLISEFSNIADLNYSPFESALRQGQYIVTLEALGYNGAKMYAVFVSAGFQAPFSLIGTVTDASAIGSDYKLRVLWADATTLTVQGYAQGLVSVNAYVNFIPFKV